jgi:hypothetical protein
MTGQEKLGLVALVLLFVTLIVLLVVSFRPSGEAAINNFEDSVIVRQRIQNLEKSNVP